MVVAVQIGPDRRVRIEKLTTFYVAKNRAVSARDNNWFALQPVGHLRERMPHELVVQLRER